MKKCVLSSLIAFCLLVNTAHSQSPWGKPASDTTPATDEDGTVHVPAFVLPSRNF